MRRMRRTPRYGWGPTYPAEEPVCCIRARFGSDPRAHSPAHSWHLRAKPAKKHPHSTSTGASLPAPNSAIAPGTRCWEIVPVCTKHISVCSLETSLFPHFLGYSLRFYTMGKEKCPSPLPLPSAPSQHPLSLASSVKLNSCNPLNHFS